MAALDGANTAAALAKAGDTELAQAIFTQALHAANTALELSTIDPESATAGDSKQARHAADGASNAVDQARFAPCEVMMASQKHESMAVIMVMLALILAVVWLCYLVARSS